MEAAYHRTKSCARYCHESHTAMKTARDLSTIYIHAFLITFLVTVGACALAHHLIYNWTESLPLGFYWLERDVEPVRGELVAFPIPNDVRQIVHDRRYVPDGAYLVKPVVGLPGDRVCADGGVFTVNDEVIGRVLVEDRAGRPLPHPYVCKTVVEGEVYVASTNPRSFDSRTFGSVPSKAIRGRVTPLWIF